MLGVKNRRRVTLVSAYGVMLLVIVWTFLPFYLALVLSTKYEGDFFQPKFIPFLQYQPTLLHWRYEWRTFLDPAGIGHGLSNSTIVASSSTLLSLILGSLAAYGIRLIHRGRAVVWPLFVLFLLPRILPPAVTFVPFTIMMRWFGLTDTLLALTFAHTALTLPLAVIILYGVVADLPSDLLDAAQIDGCSQFVTYRLIVLPLLVPALLATAAICFALSWNEFLFALANAQQYTWTAPLSIASLLTKDGIEFEYVGSHLLLVLLPPTLLALLARRYVVRGFSWGTVKEKDLA